MKVWKTWLMMMCAATLAACGGSASNTATGSVAVVPSPAVGAVLATPQSMDVFGTLPAARMGDVVDVFDAQGIRCGTFTVSVAGQYGFLHVYGDDPTTPADEGATVGDSLSFSLNGQPLTVANGQTVRWLGDRTRQRVDF